MRIEQDGVSATIPASTAEIASHFATLGLSATDAAGLSLYMLAATDAFEQAAGLAVIQRTVRLYLDEWPKSANRMDDYSDSFYQVPIAYVNGSRDLMPLELPVGPVIAGATYGVSAVADDGTVTPINAAALMIDTGRFAIVRQKSTYTDLQSNYGSRFIVTYTAGFGLTAAQVPADIRLAILDQALKYYEQRGDTDQIVGRGGALIGTTSQVAARYKRIRV